MSTAGTGHQGWRRAAGAALALALLGVVLAVAGPAAVWRLLATARLQEVLPAAAAAALVLAARGVRLLLLLPGGELRPVPAVLTVAVAQAAALFLPARAGEAALPLLLRRVAGLDLAAGVGTLLAARALDLAALGVWAGGAFLAVSRLDHPLALAAAAALLLPALALPWTLAAADRLAVRLLAPRGLGGRRWTRRIRRLRRAVTALTSRPLRLAAAALASLLVWAFTWVSVFFLLVALGYRWPPMTVVAGSAAGSLANLLPVGLVANLGTLEAGWTAGFSALGIPPRIAAATGLATHLWGLLFAAAYGALAWLALSWRGANVKETQRR